MIISAGGQKFHVRDMRGMKSFKGLMFDPVEDDGAIISGNSIWMPFVAMPLFLYFLSSDFRLVGRQKAIPLKLFHPSTWRVYGSPPACCCLELKRPVRNARIGMQFRVM